MAPSEVSKVVSRSHHAATTEDGSQEIAIDISVGAEGIAPRKSIKTTKMPDIENNGSRPFDDDDDKYRKPHLSHLLDGLMCGALEFPFPLLSRIEANSLLFAALKTILLGKNSEPALSALRQERF